MKKILFIILFITTLNFQSNLLADTPYFINFSKVLNQSAAGKEAQTYIKNKLLTQDKKFLQRDKSLKEEEKKLVAKKKLISNDEYIAEVQKLRKKVSLLQGEKRKVIQDVANLRKEGREKLLKALTPIIETYMEKNNIRMVIDKKDVILADTKLEITSQIITILDKEIKSLNLK